MMDPRFVTRFVAAELLLRCWLGLTEAGSSHR
jgi:hypothetical protein